MHALILDGMDADDSFSRSLITSLNKVLGASASSTATLSLRKLQINWCQGCFNCWVKTPGICCQHDDGLVVNAAEAKADLIIFLGQVSFGGYSSHIKRALDRTIPMIMPFFTKIDGEVHHTRRYFRRQSLLNIGIMAQPDPESTAIFTALMARNAINFHSQNYATITLSPTDTGATASLAAALTGLLEQLP